MKYRKMAGEAVQNKKQEGRRKMGEKRLCVAYAADDNYAKHQGISMLSLFQSNQEFEEIDVFVLDCGISDRNQEKLQGIAEEYGRKIVFVPAENAVSGLDLRMGARKISTASYARLFLTSILPEGYDKVLYLDCDTIVRDSVKEFWNMDMQECMVAGVCDTVDSFFLKKIGLDAGDYYVNAGVILVNLDAWRRERIEKSFIEFIQKFEGNVPHHDQGTINGVCKGRKKIVHPRFNTTSNLYSFSEKTIKSIYFMDSFYSQKELDEAKENPAIIHFTSGLVGRPWEDNCTHPMKEEYRKAAASSPWGEAALLPESRKVAVKVFAFFHRHVPLLAEVLYRWLSKLAHVRE